jgi:hypothetical protein
MADTAGLHRQLEAACRRLLGAQQRDAHAPTHGCFDRRYWAWKTVDFPEATFQRAVYPLAWLLGRGGGDGAEVLRDAVEAGLVFAARVQHRDGSFDQAFPHEHSFGATAFLLHPMLSAYAVVHDGCAPATRATIERGARRAADFLCAHDEEHGHIANHLAGAALALLTAERFFGDPRYGTRAGALLDRVLSRQSREGWFLEYEGADPGYQTLCMTYLAEVYHLRADAALRHALERAVEFLAWFVHPDGTFAGDYGSRRTAVYYPGGLARLSREVPLALSITRFMLESIAQGRTVTAMDVDDANLAPLLSSYVVALGADVPDGAAAPPLPWQREPGAADFPEAGLHARVTPRHFGVVGASNGGVVKVFDRAKQALVWSDGGYVGGLGDGDVVTSQITSDGAVAATPDTVTVEARFHRMPRAVPTPARFVALRLANLTVMRSLRLGNWVKRGLVRLLVTGKRPVPLILRRVVRFEPERVVLHDALRLDGRLDLRWLRYGRPFVGIHMASAGYFEGFGARPTVPPPAPIDVAALQPGRPLTRETVIA